MARESAADKEAREAQEAADALAAGATQSAAHPEVDDEQLVVKVPAEHGDNVSLTRGGVEIGSYKIDSGKITAKDAAERDMLLGSIPGASL